MTFINIVSSCFVRAFWDGGLRERFQSRRVLLRVVNHAKFGAGEGWGVAGDQSASEGIPVLLGHGSAVPATSPGAAQSYVTFDELDFPVGKVTGRRAG